jgi:predicted NAD/FAD-dependent oxidoreductase
VLRQLAHEAAVVVTEHMPVPPLAQWTDRLATTTPTPVWRVDTACVVPMPLVPRAFDRAFAFRDATARLRRERLTRPWVDVPPTVSPAEVALPFAPVDVATADIAALVAACAIDHSIGPVHDTRGGAVAGMARWRDFVDGGGLARYAERRNDAARPLGVSRMSPYVHYGMVSPMALAREAAARPGDGPAKWLDELLIWRELAYVFCHHTPALHSVSALPRWAVATLAAHEEDPRDRLPWETLARGETGDALWDAAQRSLLRHGELHNNVRMTWGKAIPGWSRDTAEALARLVDLNHRYALDGRDPSSYGGLLWCLGQFDRPFTPEQPVLGTVRGRSTREHAARLDLSRYAAHVARPMQPSLGQVVVIGAGLSGLMAARVLSDAGAPVTVLDKSHGVGGRTATRRTGPWAFDHGAQYATFRDSRLAPYVASWADAGVLAPWEAPVMVREDGTWRGAPPGTTRWVAVPGMSALARHLARGLTIRVNTPVARAHRHGARWHVLGANGELVAEADHLLVTAPSAQAAQLLGAEAPALTDACARVTWHPCRAAMVVLAREAPVQWGSAFVNDDPVLAWVARNASKPGRDAATECWVLHATRAHSVATLEDAPDVAVGPLVEAFRRVLGPDAPEVVHAASHRWRYAVPEPVLPEACVWDDTVQAGLAGDWCGGPRVEGALLSGVALAGRLLGAVHAADTINGVRGVG